MYGPDGLDAGQNIRTQIFARNFQYFKRYSPSHWSDMKSDFRKIEPELGLIFTQKIVHDDPETFYRENNFTNYSFIEDHYVKARVKVFS